MRRMLSAQHSHPNLNAQSKPDEYSTRDIPGQTLPALNLEVSVASQWGKRNEIEEEEDEEDVEMEM